MESIIERLQQKDWHLLKEELNTKGYVNIQNVVNEKGNIYQNKFKLPLVTFM